MEYGEIIIGPPGSGKTTYILNKSDKIKRKTTLINLDPGNETTSIFDFDIRQIYKTESYMSTGLGPNCAIKEILTALSNDLSSFFDPILSEGSYYIFDFPGQIEFFLVNDSLKQIVKYLQNKHISLIVVNLVDSVLFYDMFNRISINLLCTLCMLVIEVPQVCVISKCDNLKYFDQNLENLMNCAEKLPNDRFLKEIVEFVRGNSLVSYELLDVNNIDTLYVLQYVIDCVTGYVYNVTEEDYFEFKDRDEVIATYEISDS